MTGSRWLRRRRIAAVLMASLFLGGAVTSVRACPHHDDSIAGQVGHLTAPDGDGHNGHGYASQRDGTSSESAPHACLCADLCQMGGMPGSAASDSRISVLPVERANGAEPPEREVVEQPTRHLIPLPNGPPFLV